MSSLGISRSPAGSTSECECLVQIVVDLEYADRNACQTLIDQTHEVRRMLSAYRRYVANLTPDT